MRSTRLRLAVVERGECGVALRPLTLAVQRRHAQPRQLVPEQLDHVPRAAGARAEEHRRRRRVAAALPRRRGRGAAEQPYERGVLTVGEVGAHGHEAPLERGREHAHVAQPPRARHERAQRRLVLLG